MSQSDEPKKLTPLGCSHYKRKCKLISPCCGKEYNCRFCHDDAESNHTLNRKSVEEVICLSCSLKQCVSNQCINPGCGTKFGEAYFCAICKLFDDEDKGQFHCDGCGICRVGGKENFEHCNTCGLCLPIGKSHKCISNTSHNNCPVCLEDIHTSRREAHIPPCSHLLHTDCFQSMMKQNLYACPTCGSSMLDMTRAYLDRKVARTPMPTEYANLYREILCKDCNKNCIAPFHIVGMKCNSCGSYNTTLDKGPLLRMEQAEGEEKTYTPLTDAELSSISNVPFSIPENESDITSDGSNSEDGWETTEENVENGPDSDNEMVEEDLD